MSELNVGDQVVMLAVKLHRLWSGGVALKIARWEMGCGDVKRRRYPQPVITIPCIMRLEGKPLFGKWSAQLG